jgi:hypothetical protein
MNLKLLWLCTKAKPYLTRIWKNQFELATSKEVTEQDALNGKIFAESDFDCEEIIHTYENKGATYHHFDTETLDNEQLLRRSLIIGQSIDEYLGNRQYDKNNNVVGYATHIKNLNIFDKPKKLGMAYYSTLKSADKIQKAPQNMCIVRSYYPKDYFEKYVLISVTPQEACNILNHKQDILIRKNVLKEML